MGHFKNFLREFTRDAKSLEQSWQKALLVALPIGMLGSLLGLYIEPKAQQLSPFDQNAYVMVLVSLILSWLTLASGKINLRWIMLALIAGLSLFFLGKQSYILFALPKGFSAPIELPETLFWTPFIYILCFLVAGGYGSRLATGYTLASSLITLVYISLHLTNMNQSYWSTLATVVQFNLSNIAQLMLSFAFINLKNRYSQTRDQVAVLEKVAHTDPLTGLPNRLVLQKALERALQDAKSKNQKVAVLFIDLDRFKLINDTLGHQSGDRLLELVSKRLTSTVKKGDFVARISGDEFVVITRKVDRPQMVSLIAQRILAAFSEPFEISGQSLTVTASIGSSLFPDDGEDVESLLRNADGAMYKVKKHGKNGIKAFEKTDEKLEYRWQLEKDLRVALEQRQLSLYYQPMYDLNTGKLVKFETLLRWKHPEKGFISPAEFIPLAEEGGMIVTLGAWVLEEACHQAKAWQNLGLSYKVSVNVSLLQFSHPNFVLAVLNAVKESGLSGTYLELEITESVVMSQPTEVNNILATLKEAGIQLAMDDFGTGYSSLAYLRDLPIDTVKIDKSFVQKLDAQNTEPFSRALVETIVGLASHLNLQVVAEGVETAEQCTLLKQLGCHIGQGYYFSKPIPPQDLERFLLKLRQNAKPKLVEVR
jgi:diguanylate cyclase